MSKKLKSSKSEEVGWNYNGDSYVKPRRMLPRKITKENSDSFTEGHVKKPRKK